VSPTDAYTPAPTAVYTPAPTEGAYTCAAYCESTGCGWTSSWSCPWAAEDGSVGRAGDDGSIGYDCCCNQRNTCGIEVYTDAPTVSPTTEYPAMPPGCNCMNPTACGTLASLGSGEDLSTCGYFAGEAPTEYMHIGESSGCRDCNGCWNSGKCYPAEQYSFDAATSTMTHMPTGASQTM
jgi:hypothetical protein